MLNSATDLDVAFGPPIRPGDINQGVTYSTPVGSDNFLNIDTGGGFEGGFLDGFYGGDLQRRLTVTFDGPVAAFGFDTSELAAKLEVVVSFSDSTKQTYSTVVGGGGLSFFGFTRQSGSNIVSATIDGDGNQFALAVDNFSFTTPVRSRAPMS